MGVDYEVLGKRVFQYRNEKGLTQLELANLSGNSQGYIGKLEAGKYKSTTAERLDRVATALGVTMDDLLFDSLDAFKGKPDESIRALQNLLGTCDNETLKKFSTYLDSYLNSIGK